MFLRPGSTFSSLSVYKLTQNIYMGRNQNEVDKQKKMATNDYFCIVFDAGSTGTRIHIFHFKKAQG